jgi:hypothetical protein
LYLTTSNLPTVSYFLISSQKEGLGYVINLYFYGLLPECSSDFKDILDKPPCESDMDYIQVGGWLKTRKAGAVLAVNV